MKNIIHSPEQLPLRKTEWYVFLAGPIQGAPEWQNTLPDISGVTYLSPRRKNYDSFNYSEQLKWERIGLRIADVILFWVPSAVEVVEGRDYAQTTRTEFGEYLGRGKKMIVGINTDFPGRRYFVSLFPGTIHDSLEACVKELQDYIDGTVPHIWFTSDTHFSSQRALELSKRPFPTVPDMDWAMIQKWNDKVKPGDKVYHLGDFGDLWPSQYLNGNIELILGNYERSEGVDYMYKLLETFDSVKDEDTYGDILLYHEPLEGRGRMVDSGSKFLLFGHIHGRQKIKHFGIDVGVDGNNYEPLSDEDVKFYREAIEKGYYDDNVWVE